MAIFILITLFSLFACLESGSYGFYEWQVNQNKVRWNCFISSFFIWFGISYYHVFFYLIQKKPTSITF